MGQPKQRKLKLHSNDNVLDLHMEIGGTEDMTLTEEEVITEHIRDMKLDKLVKPEEFHALLPTVKDIYPCNKRRFTVSNYHCQLMEELRRGGVFRAGSSDMLRGVISLGIVALCRGFDIQKRKLEKMFQVNDGDRVEKNFKQLERALKCLNCKEENTRIFLHNLVSNSNKTRYGEHIWGKLYSPYDMVTPEYSKEKPKVSAALMASCKIITKDKFELSKAIRLTRKVDNQKLDGNISWRLAIALDDLRVKKYQNLKTSEITRVCFVSGLFIICKWIKSGRFSKEEFGFNGLMHKLNDYIGDTCVL